MLCRAACVDPEGPRGLWEPLYSGRYWALPREPRVPLMVPW